MTVPAPSSSCGQEHPAIIEGVRYRLRNNAIAKVERTHTFRGVSTRGPWEHTMWRGHIVGTRQLIHWTLEGHYGANYCGHELDIVRRAR